MASPIEAQLILADAAQASGVGGKVHMLGAGWSITTSPTAPAAVVGLIKIPWDLANQKIAMLVELVDEDGKPVQLPGPKGDEPVRFGADLEVGRPAGLKPGTPIDASFTVNVAPMPLSPGRYSWRLQLGDDVVLNSFQVLGP